MTTSSGITRREALRRGLTVGGAALVWTAPSAQAFAMTTATGQAGSLGYGCTPGFWKNHPDAWCDYEPETTLEAVGFTFGDCIEIDEANTTLMDALNWKDNESRETDTGAAKILLRHAVAALLNICSFYGNSNAADVTVPVNKLLTCPANRDAILELKNTFQDWNERDCPWSGKEPYNANA